MHMLRDQIGSEHLHDVWLALNACMEGMRLQVDQRGNEAVVFFKADCGSMEWWRWGLEECGCADGDDDAFFVNMEMQTS
eukprot:365369-Chlamydomonas_euryale.AAC.4